MEIKSISSESFNIMTEINKKENNIITENPVKMEISKNIENDSMLYKKRENFQMDQGKSKSEETPQLMDIINSGTNIISDLTGDKDLELMEQMGFAPDKEDLGSVVTVYERIQIELAAYGDGSGVTGLTIDSEKMEKVLNSKAMAEGIEKSEDLSTLSDSGKVYILGNDLDPTIENVYKSQYSNKGNNIYKKSDEEWETVKPLVENVIEKSGMELSNENIDSSKFLFQNNIDITPENIIKNIQLNQVMDTEDYMENVIAPNIINNTVLGREGKDAFVTKDWMSKENRDDFINTLENADEDTVGFIVDKDYTLNKANLDKYSDIKNDSLSKNDRDNEKYNKALNIIITAKNILTQSGLLSIQKLGVNIEYTNISKLNDLAIKENDKYYKSFFDDNEVVKEDVDQLTKTMAVMEEMSSIPISVMGSILNQNLDYNLNNIYNEGRALKESFDSMTMTYEAVGTQVRPDLGDSIKKAFNNIENLVLDTGLETNEDNIRAARVLGYNNMTVSKENISIVASKIGDLQSLQRNLTPKTAVYLIQNKVNIMDKEISELNQEIRGINEKNNITDNEDYARALWKMERSGDISIEEREAYIEMYRQLKEITKEDSRSIGAAIDTGSTMTLQSLLALSKSDKLKGMDIKADDSTGYFEGNYIKNKLNYIIENIGSNNKDIEKEIKKELDETSKYKQVSEEAVYKLMNGNSQVSYENLSLYMAFNTPDSKLKKLLKEENTDIVEKFTDMESGEEEINNYIIDKVKKDEDNISWMLKMKAMNFIHKGTGNKSYTIPANINNEDIFINVTFKKNSVENGRGNIEIDFESEVLGKVSARLKMTETALNGNVYCENQEGAKIINNSMDNFRAGFDNLIVNIRTLETGKITMGVMKEFEGEEGYTEKEIPDSRLYQAAKMFIRSFK